MPCLDEAVAASVEPVRSEIIAETDTSAGESSMIDAANISTQSRVFRPLGLLLFRCKHLLRFFVIAKYSFLHVLL